jgi:UrcA family protein
MSCKSSKLSAIHATRARQVLWTAIGVMTVSLLSINARAEEPATSMRVSLTGLNLAKADDAHAAYAKLQAASRKVCENVVGRDLRTRRENARCYQDTLRSAIESTRSPSLARLLDSDQTIRIAQQRTVVPSGS